MNDTIPYKELHQTSCHRMCWAALGMMIACKAATIYDPVRISQGNSIRVVQYLALCGLVGSHFELGK